MNLKDTLVDAAPGDGSNPVASIFEMGLISVVVVGWVIIWVLSTMGHADPGPLFDQIGQIVVAFAFYYIGARRGTGTPRSGNEGGGS